AGHVACIGREGRLAGRAAARAGSDVALREQAALDELADALPDDRPAEAGPGHELRSGSRSTQPHLVEDDDQRVKRLVGEWPSPDRAWLVVAVHGARSYPSRRSTTDFCP